MAFPVLMAVAGAFGAVSIPLPGVGAGIALSGIVSGAMVMFAVLMPVRAAMMIVGVFALFYGHAHGAELSASANPMADALGFVSATGTLHLSGSAVGSLGKSPLGHDSFDRQRVPDRDGTKLRRLICLPTRMARFRVGAGSIRVRRIRW